MMGRDRGKRYKEKEVMKWREERNKEITVGRRRQRVEEKAA